MVAGPNGSGKTTFARAYQAEHGGTYLSADVVADELRSSGGVVSDVAAGREFFARLNRLLDQGKDLIIESTLAGRGIVRHLDRAREHGYDIRIVFIFLESAEVRSVHRPGGGTGAQGRTSR